MNIFLQELKAGRKFTIIWLASLIALLLLFLTMYTAIETDSETFIKALENYPEEMRNMMGMKLESITSVLGFYGFTISFCALLGAVEGMYLGCALISKETREKTADFLLTRPISRITVMTSKILAGLSIILITNIIIFIFNYSTLNIITKKTFDFSLFTIMTLSFLFIQLMFYVLGTLLSVILNKIKSPLPISLGVVFAFYAISSFVATEEDDFTRYLTPFRYFDPNYIYFNEKFDLSFLITAIILTIISITVSYIIFIKKDIHAV